MLPPPVQPGTSPGAKRVPSHSPPLVGSSTVGQRDLASLSPVGQQDPASLSPVALWHSRVWHHRHPCHHRMAGSIWHRRHPPRPLGTLSPSSSCPAPCWSRAGRREQKSPKGQRVPSAGGRGQEGEEGRGTEDAKPAPVPGGGQTPRWHPLFWVLLDVARLCMAQPWARHRSCPIPALGTPNPSGLAARCRGSHQLQPLPRLETQDETCADPHRGEAKEPTRRIPSWGAAPGVEGLGALGDWGHWEGMGQRAP